MISVLFFLLWRSFLRGSAFFSAYVYDGLGRISRRTVNAGGTGVATTYGYLAGGHGTGSTTPLVQTITLFGATLTYAYDDAGNITSVSDGVKTISYAYDLLGQLIRANDPYDATAGSNGTTWVYAYDLGGNILSKTAYAYTTGTVSFTYNEDGLRVQKVATSTGTTKYTLHGKNIVHMTSGSNSLHFFYDAQNKPAVVLFNGTAYAYLYNLQGDVIALVDANGSKVVEYKYDAWGRIMSRTGTMANTLGLLNPFRYRGYVYDEETACYYLKTRFYNSVICRFVNADSIIFSNASHNMNNLYLYCKDNPVNYADENGLMGIAIVGYLIMETLKAVGICLMKGLGIFGAAVVGTELGNSISSYNSVDYDTRACSH